MNSADAATAVPAQRPGWSHAGSAQQELQQRRRRQRSAEPSCLAAEPSGKRVKMIGFNIFQQVATCFNIQHASTCFDMLQLASTCSNMSFDTSLCQVSRGMKWTVEILMLKSARFTSCCTGQSDAG